MGPTSHLYSLQGVGCAPPFSLCPKGTFIRPCRSPGPLPPPTCQGPGKPPTPALSKITPQETLVRNRLVGGRTTPTFLPQSFGGPPDVVRVPPLSVLATATPNPGIPFVSPFPLFQQPLAFEPP